MQRKITLAGILFLATAAIMLTAASQQQKDKNNNGNPQKNEAKGNKGQSMRPNNGNGQDNKQDRNMGRQNEQRGNKRDDYNKGNGNNKKVDRNDFDKDEKIDKKNNGNNGNDNNGRNNNGRFDDAKLKFNKNALYGYNWNDDDYKDRKRYKNQEKVFICHKVKRNDEPGVAIRVSESALKAHMNHGDIIGDCPAISNSIFSDGFLRNRRDYYNNLQQTQEEIYYSRSVLDYALIRLASSRSQLQQMQNSNMPVADIQRKQQAVAALEQNTSLLQTLVGVAVEVVANRLL